MLYVSKQHFFLLLKERRGSKDEDHPVGFPDIFLINRRASVREQRTVASLKFYIRVNWGTAGMG